MADNSNEMVFARAALELLRNTPGWRDLPPQHREWAMPVVAAIEAGDRRALKVARGKMPATGQPSAYNCLSWIAYVAVVDGVQWGTWDRRGKLRAAAAKAGVDMVAFDTLLDLFPLPALGDTASRTSFSRYEPDDEVLS